jgi:hypothetical protein
MNLAFYNSGWSRCQVVIQLISNYFLNKITVGFWCQAMHKKFLQRFATSFDIKMMMEMYPIEIVSKSHEPFQSYHLTGPANQLLKVG